MAVYNFFNSPLFGSLPVLPEGTPIRMTTTTYNGGEGSDTVFGTSLSDTIKGNGGNDKLYGASGWDSLHGGSGDDTLSGGSGIDVLRGGDDNDWLYGGADGDTLYGEDGVDHLYGGSGNDLLGGGAGADYIDGGDGVDTLSYFASPEGVYVDLAEGKGLAIFDLNSGIAYGGDASGDTIVNVENIYGSAYDDVLIGDSGDNEISGYDGNDTLYGGDGNDVLNGDSPWGISNDVLYGENGNDILNGGGGADTLDGGRDDDILTGGRGYDTFIISDEGDNDDTITDFEIGVDTLHFDSNTAIDDLGDLDGWRVDQEGDNLVIDIGSNELTLEGVNRDDFIEFVQSDAAADYFTFG